MKIVCESLHQFKDKSDPIRDMGIGVQYTQKDKEFIQHLLSIGNDIHRWKTAKRNANSIKNKNKAFGRYLAAKEVEDIKGAKDIASTYLVRAAILGHEDAIRIYDATHKIPFEEKKTFFKSYNR